MNIVGTRARNACDLVESNEGQFTLNKERNNK